MLHEEDIPIQELIETSSDRYSNTKIIAFQSFLYISALYFTISAWISFINFKPSLVSWYKSTLLVLSCLQGVENLFIFLFHKVYNQKRSCSYLSTWDAITQVFHNGGVHDVFVMSRMHILSDLPINNTYVVNGASIVGDSEEEDDDTISEVKDMSEIRNHLDEPIYETNLKRYSRGIQRPSPENAVSLTSQSGYASFGVSANYGGSLSGGRLSKDSIISSQSDTHCNEDERMME